MAGELEKKVEQGDRSKFIADSSWRVADRAARLILVVSALSGCSSLGIKPLQPADKSTHAIAAITQGIGEQGYDLVGEGLKLVDRGLFSGGSFANVEFFLDPKYYPGNTGGSLGVEIGLWEKGFYRIYARDIGSKPRDLVNASFSNVSKEIPRRWPETAFEIAQAVEIFIGYGASREETYVGMRRYGITLTEQGLKGFYHGLEDVDLESITITEIVR